MSLSFWMFYEKLLAEKKGTPTLRLNPRWITKVENPILIAESAAFYAKDT